MTYKDKTARPFVLGDYVYYTERPYSEYADSLGMVVLHKGQPTIKTVVYNRNGYYEQIECDNRVSFEFHSHPHDFKTGKIDESVCCDSLILDNVITDDLVQYMNDTFPLGDKDEL